MCLYPNLIKNRKYKANKKNGGNVPPILDERVKLVAVGCTNCIECRKQKARQWQVRLLEDIKSQKGGIFVTLTFSTESIINLREYEKNGLKLKDLEGYEQDNEITTVAVRLFNERWRKIHKKAIRHWLVTELGHRGTENIHLHGIIWMTKTYKYKEGLGNKRTEVHTTAREELLKRWKYGYIWPRNELDWRRNYVNGRTVSYITKYVSKKDIRHKEYKSIILTSPGIGNCYTKSYNSNLNKYKGEETNETYTTETGHKIAMPVYWRNKIYTEEEREKLWLQRLDKMERWICGEKISIKYGDKEYYNILNHHRIRNKQLGYGDDTKNWSRQEYERQRRIIVQHERIKEYNNKKK